MPLGPDALSELRSRMRTQLDEIEETANGVSDADVEWWPFVFLRPRPDEPLSSLRVCVLAVLYGAPASLGMLLLDAAARRHAAPSIQLCFVASVCAAIFIAYRVTFAYFWNRRAARLARRAVRDRHEAGDP
jgi:hypothetical protein